MVKTGDEDRGSREQSSPVSTRLLLADDATCSGHITKDVEGLSKGSEPIELSAQASEVFSAPFSEVSI